MILVSAVHFRGTWLHQFATARPKTFHLNLFKKIEVPTMYLKKYLPYRYLKEINAHAVRLDFLVIIIVTNIHFIVFIISGSMIFSLCNIDHSEVKNIWKSSCQIE